MGSYYYFILITFSIPVTILGSNFDDEQEKTTGGRNGYGAKLANIFSKEFKIETADSERGLKYAQVFNNNMGQKSSPEIKKYTGPDFTCITFKPDLQRFKMDFLDDDIVSLLSKRVYDIAGTSMAAGSRLNVHLNGSKIEIRNFEQVIFMYENIAQIYEKVFMIFLFVTSWPIYLYICTYSTWDYLPVFLLHVSLKKSMTVGRSEWVYPTEAFNKYPTLTPFAPAKVVSM